MKVLKYVIYAIKSFLLQKGQKYATYMHTLKGPKLSFIYCLPKMGKNIPFKWILFPKRFKYLIYTVCTQKRNDMLYYNICFYII